MFEKMTYNDLRNWFAGQALQGFCTRNDLGGLDARSKIAFEQADSMLEHIKTEKDFLAGKGQ